MSYPPYAPADGGAYPPAQAYPPPNVGYAPPSPGYHHGYPADQGYPPPTQAYPPPAQGYPPPAQGYPPPMQGGYPPAMGYPPPQGDVQFMPMAPGTPVTQPPVMGGGGYPPSGGDMAPMGVSPGIPSCPPGLEYLTTIDQLLVHQKVEMLEAFLGFETQNKYTIKNSMGQKVYKAVEDTDCCSRNCCGPNRPFDIKFTDNAGNEVIHLQRDLRCSSCCFPCCLQKLEVSSPPYTPIGYVIQEWSICIPKFRVENAERETVLRIEGPFCTWSICGDVEFKVLSKDGAVEVGRISKQWSGLLKESFTDTDNFGISFPMDLDVKMKAVLLGALFLIDYMFFEKAGNKESDRPGML
ncbi:phospholipid scramblase 2 isoform X1 [Rhipicephalus sanguineus]|uniref:phospholipid scramblase 2 isoform X1 n=1 Tax=Rhipicephalus sanguineus TaxID=34632 RepID=UPI001893490D|nr:phospholipid scramblase 2 isoform X1 [Rhipicephalus sanguineus]XP_049269338.1 phospholipid scramblase 2 isoform X1 [Rhipicephalus sanguineus]